MPIPLQHETDMSDAISALTVGLVAADGMMWPSEEKLRDVAEHLAKFGVRWHPELQTVWYRPPREGASWLEQSQGQWVTGKEPGVPPEELRPTSDVDALIGTIPEELRVEMIRKLGGEVRDGGSPKPDAE